MKRWLLFALAMFALVVVLFLEFGIGYTDGYYMGDKAAFEAKALAKAVNGYANKRNGQFPAQLLDLVEPPDGSGPMIEGGAAALIDPWGHQYRYAVQPDETGKPTAYVWAEDGKGNAFGTKPPGK